MHSIFSARTRIALGLASLLSSALLLAIVLRVIPDRREAVLQGRANLCEAVAVNSSALVSRADLRRLEAILTSIVARNDDLLSAAVRRYDGVLCIVVGDHMAHWNEVPEERSIESHIQVGLFAGDNKWGRIEFSFTPISASGLWGVITSPWMRMVVFICAISLLMFYFYLGKMLQHLDPSQAVPGRVRTALDTLAEGLLVLDRKGRVVLANESFATGVGLEPHDLVGRDAAKLGWINVDGSPASRPYPWEQAIQHESAQLGVMMGLNSANDQRQIFKVNCNPVMGSEGQYRGVLTSFDDVTQLEETKIELAESKEAAETANQAKSEFLARMSHEIRTPMNAILGFTDLMRRGIDVSKHERMEYLTTIHTSGQHLLNLINDILDLSKVEAGKLELESKEFSPVHIVAEVVDIMQARAEEKAIALTYESDGLVPATIASDPTRLRQVITNLVGNAIKFTDEGSVKVSTRIITSDGVPQLAIDIADTGIGLTQDAQQKIFDPFEQADNSVTRKFGGTGLGLSISKRFCEAMGGDLSVVSEYGKGSVFTAKIETGCLEGVETIDATGYAIHHAQPSEELQELTLPPSRILVADDSDANRKLMKLVLSRAGAIADMAENGQIAIDMAEQVQYDVILMDMQMPVMDGATATTHLREKGFAQPIIALTADAMKGSKEKCLAAGCSGFLAKPVDMDLLINTLSTELAKRPHSADLVKSEPDIIHPTSNEDQSGPEKSMSEQSDSIARELEQSKASDTFAHSEQSPSEVSTANSQSATSAGGEPLHSSLPMDDPEICAIVKGWTARLDSQMDEIRTAADDRDHEKLASLAHWLKGSAGTVGFRDFTQPAKELQEAAQEGDTDRIEQLVANLVELANRIAVLETA